MPLHNASDSLPHAPPAVLLKEFSLPDGDSLTAHVQLDELDTPWAQPEGLPVAFGLEIIAQAAALYMRSNDTEQELIGGRLVACDSFDSITEFLPCNERLTIEVHHQGASAMGYHKFSGTLCSASGCRLDVAFSVFALRKS